MKAQIVNVLALSLLVLGVGAQNSKFGGLLEVGEDGKVIVKFEELQTLVPAFIKEKAKEIKEGGLGSVIEGGEAAKDKLDEVSADELNAIRVGVTQALDNVADYLKANEKSSELLKNLSADWMDGLANFIASQADLIQKTGKLMETNPKFRDTIIKVVTGATALIPAL